jgi:putative thiamine transport system ATP-binding protein
MSLHINIQNLMMSEHRLISNLQLDCEAGQIVTLMGPSGSGKSSLLSAIAGLPIENLHFEGDVLLHGKSIKNLPTSQRRIGLLFQDDLLFAHMTIRENLLFATPNRNPIKRTALADQALNELGFQAMADRSPLTLSGGQRARVSLMRTLLSEPQALLLDEPFSKLDAQLRGQFREFVFSHARRLGLPTLLVTHDAADIADAQRVVVIQELPIKG